MKHVIRVEIPSYEGSSSLIELWLVPEGDKLAVRDGETLLDYVFQRALVMAALEAALRKRNNEYVLIDPTSMPEGWTEEADGFPDTPTFHRRGDGIVYTHHCGVERYIPRATARALLAALAE